MIAESWKQLPEDERAEFHERARSDRDRYEREKASYKGPWKIPDVKDPTAPKKPMSSFLAFSNERRRQIASADPTMNGTEISCRLAQLWKDCPPEVKQKYREREAREREAFKKTRAEWQRQKNMRETHAMASASDVDWTTSSAQIQPSPFHGATLTPGTPVSSPEAIFSGQDLFLPNQLVHNRNLSDNATMSFGQSLQQHMPGQCLEGVGMQTAMRWNANSSFSLPCLPPEQQYQRQDTLARTHPQSRFHNYSMDDVLQDDELFEDFSPIHVPTVLPNSSTGPCPDDDNKDTCFSFHGPFGF